jgi:GNAT superfamily N-acetyltransferase
MTDRPNFSRYDAAGALAIAESVIAPLYEATHTDVLQDPFYSTQRFLERLAGYATRDGFELVIANHRRPVGLAFGQPLPADTRWWDGLCTPVPAGLTTENGTRTFALNELMVHPDWQRRGLAKELHDQLLTRRPEQRATLLVRADNTPARTAYHHWGWRPIGTLQPYPDSPIYQALILNLTPRYAADTGIGRDGAPSHIRT